MGVEKEKERFLFKNKSGNSIKILGFFKLEIYVEWFGVFFGI